MHAKIVPESFLSKKEGYFQMILFLLPCFPFLFLFFFITKPLSRRPFHPLLHDMTLLLVLLLQELSWFLIHWMDDCRQLLMISRLCRLPFCVFTEKNCASAMADASEEEVAAMNILDLPELALECILEKLPAKGLLRMACACRALRDVCRYDHLWESHMKEKWGSLLGQELLTKWQSSMGHPIKDAGHSAGSIGGFRSQEGRMSPFARLWSLRRLKPKFDDSRRLRKCPSVPDGSLMSFYLALEQGKLWFPAQVYNRENGHAGFLLSCYDAEVSYDCSTDTFLARYLPHGLRPVRLEEGVQWHRLRASPVDTSPRNLHVSDCSRELRPGDHVEIQWRKNKEFPYGWWYGVVGHLESCDKSELQYCLCNNSDTIMLEFNQYAATSHWRRILISRKEHREGNEIDGFYGGIRKLCSKDEISTWRRLWPTEVLD